MTAFTKVVVTCGDGNMDETEIRAHFETFGRVRKISNFSPSSAIVEFKDPEVAKTAVNRTMLKKLTSGCRIRAKACENENDDSDSSRHKARSSKKHVSKHRQRSSSGEYEDAHDAPPARNKDAERYAQSDDRKLNSKKPQRLRLPESSSDSEVDSRNARGQKQTSAVKNRTRSPSTSGSDRRDERQQVKGSSKAKGRHVSRSSTEEEERTLRPRNNPIGSAASNNNRLVLQSSAKVSNRRVVEKTDFLAAEAALQLIDKKPPPNDVVDRIIEIGCSFTKSAADFGIVLTERRYSQGLKCEDTRQCLVTKFRVDIPEVLEANDPPFAMVLVKPPEAVTVAVLGSRSFLIFDARSRRNYNAPYILNVKSVAELLQHLEFIWPPPSVSATADLQLQLLMYSFDIFVLTRSKTAIGDLPGPPIAGYSSDERSEASAKSKSKQRQKDNKIRCPKCNHRFNPSDDEY